MIKLINEKPEITKIKSIYDYIDICFDWEVFENYWCITFKEWDNKNKKILNNITFSSDINSDENTYDEIQKLLTYLKSKINNSVFIAWNVDYDKNILFTFIKTFYDLFKTTLKSEFKQKEFNIHLFNKSKEIVNNKDGVKFLNWRELRSEFHNFIFYDAMNYMGNDTEKDKDGNSSLRKSLKVAGGESGFSMLESNVPWNKKELTNDDVKEIIYYNKHDVDILFRMLLKYYPAYEVRKDLVNTFANDNHSYLQYRNNSFFNKIYKITKKDKLQNIPEYFNFYDEINSRPDLIKVKNVINLIESKPGLHPTILTILKHLKTDLLPTNKDDGGYELLLKEPPKKDDLKITKAVYLGKLWDMEGAFGLGGVHLSKSIITNLETVLEDIKSEYPHLITNYNLHSRAIKENQKDILPDLIKQRLVFKHSSDPELKKKDKPYKTVINSKYGQLRFKAGNLYDPINGTILTVLGQILMLYYCDLISPYVSIFIQANTDGVEYIPHPKSEEKIAELTKQWEKEVDLEFEKDKVRKVFNFNVNNYIIELSEKDKDGKYLLKSKGKIFRPYYVDILDKSSAELPYDNNIISRLLINLLLYQKSFQQTFDENPELWKYCAVKKISINFDYLIEITGAFNLDIQTMFASLPLTNKYLSIDNYKQIENKANRFIAIKNGKEYRKYTTKRQFSQNDEVINNDIYEKSYKVISNEILMIYNKKVKGDDYSNYFKTYQGQKIEGISLSSYIYNKPLFNNYENNFDLQKSDIKTVADFEKETNQKIDYDYYKNEVLNIIRKTYKIEDELKNFIYDYDNLIK